MTLRIQFAIVALCCCSFLQAVELRSTPQVEWISWYSEVFERPKNLSEVRILERLMQLHANIQDVDVSDPKSKHKRDAVVQIYELLRDTNTKHCNAKHMDDVREQLRQIKDPIDGNLMTIFSLVHQNLVELCMDLHADIDEIMRKEFDEDAQLYLVGFQMRYEDWFQGKISDKELKRKLLDTLVIDFHATKEQMVARWDQSACGRVLKYMKQPEMQSFRDFIELDLYLGMKSGLKLCPREIQTQIRVVNACTRLDGIIRSMPDTTSQNTNKVTRFLKTCVVGSAC